MIVELQNTVGYDNNEDLSYVNIDFKQSFFHLVCRALRERKPRENIRLRSCLPMGTCSSKILGIIPKRFQDPVLWMWLGIFFNLNWCRFLN